MPPYVASSASQINTFTDCEQYWFNASILKIPVEQSAAAFAGEALHKEAEDYTTLGKMPTHPSVLKAIEYLAPPMTPGVHAEFWLEKPDLRVLNKSIHLRGKVDYRDERDPKHPRIYDYKTKEKIDRYLKTKRTLLNDVQVNVYGAWALAKYPQAEAVTFAHIYLIRESAKPDVPFVPDAKFVPTDPVPREDILAKVVELVEAPLARMKEVAAGTVQPEKSLGKCRYWYGKICPFYDRCHVASDLMSAFATPAPTAGETSMSLMERLNAMKDAPPSIPLPEEFVGSASATSATGTMNTSGMSDVNVTSSSIASTGFELYVDTVPTKGVSAFTRLEDEIHRRSEAIIRAAGGTTLHEKPLDFGKGRDRLCDSFRTHPPTGVVLATSGGLSTAVIEVLVGLPSATKVFKGTR